MGLTSMPWLKTSESPGLAAGALGRHCAGLVTGSLVIALLAACSTTLNKTIDDAMPDDARYRSAHTMPPLEIPPDLSSSTISDAMPIPGVDGTGTGTGTGTATYSDYNDAAQKVSVRKSSGPEVLPDVSGVRLERDGDERWLVFEHATPEQVWPVAREFLLKMGLTLKEENPSVGVMETNWAENRADLPRGAIRDWLNKIIPQMGQAQTRDKFRVRLERGIKPDTTEVYISHQGAVMETTHRMNQSDSVHWVAQPPDPEIEAEMLTRLMVYAGVSQQHAQQVMAKAKAEDKPERARMVREGDGTTSLALLENFPQAWRRTGLALDRVGFTVQDRDRSRGLYYVRYADPKSVNGDEQEGLLSKLKFWGNDGAPKPHDQYLISLTADNDSTTRVVVLNKQGEPDNSATADRILSVLHEQLR